jgi:hypothetical protein
MVINFVASVMMNGVCCVHQMQYEEERKQEYHEALRRTMNVEWQRHRLMEQELEEQRLRAQGDLDASKQEAEVRRRLLMTTKQKASSAAASAASSVSSHSTIGVPATGLNDRLIRVHSEPVAAYKIPLDGRSTISTSSLLDNEDDDDDDEEDAGEGEFENIDL